MSGEINYRNFAGTPGKNPKYLSDALVNEYGTWYSSASNHVISYDDLPVGDAIARISYGALNDHGLTFQFNDRQNVLNSVAEFYYKCATNDPTVYIYVTYEVWAGGLWAADTRAAVVINADGAAPTTWTRVSRSLSSSGGFITYQPNKGREFVFTRLKNIMLYFGTIGAPPVTTNISALTIRRL